MPNNDIQKYTFREHRNNTQREFDQNHLHPSIHHTPATPVRCELEEKCGERTLFATFQWGCGAYNKRSPKGKFFYLCRDQLCSTVRTVLLHLYSWCATPLYSISCTKHSTFSLRGLLLELLVYVYKRPSL